MILSPKEQSIVKIAANAAAGDQAALKASLATASGLSLAEEKELLTQVYAYCGFPRSLNALATLMAESAARGAHSANSPSAATSASSAGGVSAALAIGTANQTKLCGAPVKGPLFDFAPAIDEYLKAHLFGDIFARPVLDWRTRELATVAMLAAMKGTEPQLKAHLAIAKHNGVTDEQAAEILRIVRTEVLKPATFPVGVPNTAYAKYFKGNSYLVPLTTSKDGPLDIANVTFEPGCRNNWHVHHDCVQVLIGLEGRGWYQEWGKPAVEIKPGVTIQIPAGVKHWHGAGPDGWFQHVAFAVKTGPRPSNEWLEPVTEVDYRKATGN